jgi:hypothetical protein
MDAIDTAIHTVSAATPSIPRSYLAGCILSTAGGSSTMTIGAGQATDSTNAAVLNLLASLNKTTASWAVGSGVGGLDTGTIAASTWYHFYLIQRVDTGVVDGLVSLSATAPTLPANYTLKRRIGSGKTDGASFWTAFTQDGRYFRLLASVLDVNTTNPGIAAVTATLPSVPTGVNVQAMTNIVVTIGTTAGDLYVSDLAVNDEAPSVTAAPGGDLSFRTGSVSYSTMLTTRTNTSAQIRYRINGSDASTVIKFVTLGWWDYAGRDS